MGHLTPIHWLILALIALLLAGGYAQFQAHLKLRQRSFFEGMNPTTSTALAGAMLLALGLLVEVYGPDWTSEALSDDVSMAMSGSGGLLVLLSFVLDRRSRRRRS